MSQDVGAGMNRKKRSHTQSGLVRFFQFIYAQKIATSWPFQFRISGLIAVRNSHLSGVRRKEVPWPSFQQPNTRAEGLESKSQLRQQQRQEDGQASQDQQDRSKAVIPSPNRAATDHCDQRSDYQEGQQLLRDQASVKFVCETGPKTGSQHGIRDGAARQTDSQCHLRRSLNCLGLFYAHHGCIGHNLKFL